VERTVTGLLDIVQHALFSEQTAQKHGFLQQIDPRVKLTGVLALIIASLAVRRIWALLGLFAACLLLAVLSRVSMRTLLSRVWLAVLAFTGAIALPAIFLTPGEIVYRLPWLNWPIYAQGLTSATLLLLRAEVAATLSVLLILTTPWARLLRSLRFFRVPVVCVVLLSMTYRYIFLLIQNASEMFEARRVRLVGFLDASDRRRLAAATAGVLLSKSFELTREVHLAMLARGYHGEVYALDERELRSGDWIRLVPLLAVALLAVWFGR
jgi:cobalt ECF transporter T component CbiQ